MKKMRKVFRIIGFSTVLAGVLALLGFVSSMRNTAPCASLEVHFEQEESMGLVLESEIRNRLLQAHGPVTGILLGEIDTRSMEETVRTLPHIKDADVYKTIDKRVLIEVEERQPIARLIDRKGRHALIDGDGYIMPLSSNAVPRLPIVSGSFAIDAMAEKSCYHVKDSISDSRLSGVFYYCQAISSDPFWVAQLQHTEVQPMGEFLAYPQVGSHTISFGKPSELEQKLKNLRVLYEHGLDEANWNKYALINLKYKDQIVCTKK